MRGDAVDHLGVSPCCEKLRANHRMRTCLVVSALPMSWKNPTRRAIGGCRRLRRHHAHQVGDLNQVPHFCVKLVRNLRRPTQRNSSLGTPCTCAS